MDNVVKSLCIRRQEGCGGDPEGAGIDDHVAKGESLLLVGGTEGSWVRQGKGRVVHRAGRQGQVDDERGEG